MIALPFFVSLLNVTLGHRWFWEFNQSYLLRGDLMLKLGLIVTL